MVNIHVRIERYSIEIRDVTLTDEKTWKNLTFFGELSCLNTVHHSGDREGQ